MTKNIQKMKVTLRTNWPIKPEAAKIDGMVFNFMKAFDITEDDSKPFYVGEQAMMAVDPSYPLDAPTWIASGDLTPA
jgi:hypothetical protein